MGSDWPTVRLGAHCLKIGSGATPAGGNSVYLNAGEICLIRSQNVHNEGFSESGLVYITDDAADKLKNVVVAPKDILLNITGDSVARVCMVKERHLPARVNQHVCIIRVDPKKFDARFVRYFLVSKQAQEYLLTLASAGATRNALTKRMIEDFEVPKPPLDIQTQIADALEAPDDKIELNNQINTTLESMAQALFKSWFVDFDPVIDNAIACGNPIPDELSDRAERRRALKQNSSSQFQLLPTEIQQLFPSSFVLTEEMGWVPEGWNITKMGNYLDVLETGRRPKGGVAGFSEGIPSVGAESIGGIGNFDFSKTKFVPFDFFASMKSGLVEDYDVLLYKDGGKPGDFKPRIGMYGESYPFEVFAINEHVFRLRSEMLGQPFLYYQVGSERSFHDLSVRGGKAAIPGINQNDVKALLMVLPNLKLIEEFNKISHPLFSSILKNSKQSFSLGKIRDVLLPKLLSGQIQIPEAEMLLNDTL